jgi:hypothetical protein
MGHRGIAIHRGNAGHRDNAVQHRGRRAPTTRSEVQRYAVMEEVWRLRGMPGMIWIKDKRGRA